jgi:hypothetical protein
MALHLIPADGEMPHAPTGECGCGPRIVRILRPDGTTRLAFQHSPAGGAAWTGMAVEVAGGRDHTYDM